MATKIDEYAPVSEADEQRERRSPAARRAPSIQTPTTSSDATGSSATNEVFSERISTWLSDRFTIVEYVSPVTVPTALGSPCTLSNTTTVS